jgi:hypothetical protein
MSIYCKDFGDAAEIPYDVLPSLKASWSDGLQYLEEAEA